MRSDPIDGDAPDYRSPRSVKVARGIAALIVVGSASYSALRSGAPFLTDASFRFGLGVLAFLFSAPVLLADPVARTLLSRAGPALRRWADIVVPVLQGATAAWAGATAYNAPHVYFVQTVGWGWAVWTHVVAMTSVLLAWWLKGRAPAEAASK